MRGGREDWEYNRWERWVCCCRCCCFLARNNHLGIEGIILLVLMLRRVPFILYFHECVCVCVFKAIIEYEKRRCMNSFIFVTCLCIIYIYGVFRL